MPKSIPLPISQGHRLLQLIALAVLASAPALRAADSAPVVAKPASTTAVTVTEDDNAFTLANVVVAARVNKRTG
ncbi:MAG: hypothetical protein ABUL61_05085, partial [Oleiharenicola lentus]